jgi:hypothetical protein
MGRLSSPYFWRKIMARYTDSVTKTQICNLALSKLGSDRIQLNDFTNDTGQVKEQCDLHFRSSLEELTRMYAWNCCTKRASANKDSSFSGKYGFSFSYDLPADAIRVLGIERDATDEMSSGSGTTGFEKNEFIVVGREIYCQIDTTIFIHYTAIPEHDSSYRLMDASFLKCFYTLLASRLAVPLTSSTEVEQALIGEFKDICLPDAKRLNSIEGEQSILVDAEYNELPIDSFNYSNFVRV